MPEFTCPTCQQEVDYLIGLVTLDDGREVFRCNHCQAVHDLERTKPGIPPRWQHQEEAFNRAAAFPYWALFMGMGTGKSRVAIELLAARRQQAPYALVVCPHSVLGVWTEEAAKYDPHLPVVLLDQSGPDQKVKTLWANRKAYGRCLFAVSYESVWRPGVGEALRRLAPQFVILDESHRAKSPGSKVSKYLFHLGKHAAFRLLLTGTPMPNSPLDIYAQFRFLDPSVFGTSFKDFAARYAVPGFFPGQVQEFINQGELAEKIASRAYQIETDDAVDLPPAVDVVRYTDLESRARTLYRQLKKDFVLELDEGTLTANNALTKLLRLHQLCGGLLELDGGTSMVVSQAKRSLLADVLDDLAQEEPVVIFCLFRHDISTARAVCREKGRSVAELSGSCNELALWKKGERNALVVQIKSGGVGIDLTRSHYAIYYSLGFSLGDYLQSRARVRRPGQTAEHVINIHLLVRSSVDTEIMAALHDKQDVVQRVLEGVKEAV